jgi:hypothetical protein
MTTSQDGYLGHDEKLSGFFEFRITSASLASMAGSQVQRFLLIEMIEML